MRTFDGASLDRASCDRCTAPSDGGIASRRRRSAAGCVPGRQAAWCGWRRRGPGRARGGPGRSGSSSRRRRPRSPAARWRLAEHHPRVDATTAATAANDRDEHGELDGGVPGATVEFHGPIHTPPGARVSPVSTPRRGVVTRPTCSTPDRAVGHDDEVTSRCPQASTVTSVSVRELHRPTSPTDRRRSNPLDRFRLDGQVAVVTGASSGLGEHFARVLHARRRAGGGHRPASRAARALAAELPGRARRRGRHGRRRRS